MSKVKSALPSSKLPPLERTEALIIYYQNAYNVWKTVPGVDKEMLDNWLFLIGSLKNSFNHLSNFGLKPGEYVLNEPQVKLSELMDQEDKRSKEKELTELETAAQNYSDKLDSTMDKRSEEFSDKKNRDTMNAIDRKHIR